LNRYGGKQLVVSLDEIHRLLELGKILGSVLNEQEKREIRKIGNTSVS
jgi:hypothetical protein